MRERVKAPLRAIIHEEPGPVGSYTIVEVLECGHQVRQRNDIFGPTNAYRRRCSKCARGELPDYRCPVCERGHIAAGRPCPECDGTGLSEDMTTWLKEHHERQQQKQ